MRESTFSSVMSLDLPAPLRSVRQVTMQSIGDAAREA